MEILLFAAGMAAPIRIMHDMANRSPERVALIRPDRLVFTEVRSGDPLPDPTPCFDVIDIHCGPAAPYPLVPTPDEILNGALGIEAL